MYKYAILTSYVAICGVDTPGSVVVARILDQHNTSDADDCQPGPAVLLLLPPSDVIALVWTSRAA